MRAACVLHACCMRVACDLDNRDSGTVGDWGGRLPSGRDGSRTSFSQLASMLLNSSQME